MEKIDTAAIRSRFLSPHNSSELVQYTKKPEFQNKVRTLSRTEMVDGFNYASGPFLQNENRYINAHQGALKLFSLRQHTPTV